MQPRCIRIQMFVIKQIKVCDSLKAELIEQLNLLYHDVSTQNRGNLTVQHESVIQSKESLLSTIQEQEEQMKRLKSQLKSIESEIEALQRDLIISHSNNEENQERRLLNDKKKVYSTCLVCGWIQNELKKELREINKAIEETTRKLEEMNPEYTV